MKNNEPLGILNIDTSLYKTRISNKFKNRKPYQAPGPKLILSFIPGTVLDILINEGQEVKTGDILMILDAMKMQNQLKCNMDGRIKHVMVRKGDKVSKGTLLLEME
jgi:biotin carboxyl carrier protein